MSAIYTQKEYILMSLLKCGSSDLDLLEDIQYDLDDIVKELYSDNCLSLNMIFHSVFLKGQYDLNEKINERLEELEREFGEVIAEFKAREICLKDLTEEIEVRNSGAIPSETFDNYSKEELTEIAEAWEEIEQIKKIDIDKDMSWYLNYLDTHVYLENGEVYKQYFEKEMDEIEDNMGFSFTY